MVIEFSHRQQADQERSLESIRRGLAFNRRLLEELIVNFCRRYQNQLAEAKPESRRIDYGNHEVITDRPVIIYEDIPNRTFVGTTNKGISWFYGSIDMRNVDERDRHSLHLHRYFFVKNELVNQHSNEELLVVADYLIKGESHLVSLLNRYKGDSESSFRELELASGSL